MLYTPSTRAVGRQAGRQRFSERTQAMEEGTTRTGRCSAPPRPRGGAEGAPRSPDTSRAPVCCCRPFSFPRCRELLSARCPVSRNPGSFSSGKAVPWQEDGSATREAPYPSPAKPALQGQVAHPGGAFFLRLLLHLLAPVARKGSPAPPLIQLPGGSGHLRAALLAACRGSPPPVARPRGGQKASAPRPPASLRPPCLPGHGRRFLPLRLRP